MGNAGALISTKSVSSSQIVLPSLNCEQPLYAGLLSNIKELLINQISYVQLSTP